MQKISVVIPIKNEEANIINLCNAIFKNLNKYENELIFIDDGSDDKSKNIIINLNKKFGNKVRGIFFDKNYGHQAAILAGLKFAKGDLIFTIDGDLQDPPRYMPEIINYFTLGEFDVVNTIRNKRPGETFARIFFIKFLYIISKLLFTKITFNSGDFRLLNRKALKLILNIDNKVFFLRSLMPKLKIKQGFFYYDRDIRQNGVSKCNFIWLINFAFQAFLASFNINFVKNFNTKYFIQKIV
jgi:glycosyltransferase involved in cell wall biosynthesis